MSTPTNEGCHPNPYSKPPRKSILRDPSAPGAFDKRLPDFEESEEPISPMSPLPEAVGGYFKMLTEEVRKFEAKKKAERKKNGEADVTSSEEEEDEGSEVGSLGKGQGDEKTSSPCKRHRAAETGEEGTPKKRVLPDFICESQKAQDGDGSSQSSEPSLSQTSSEGEGITLQMLKEATESAKQWADVEHRKDSAKYDFYCKSPPSSQVSDVSLSQTSFYEKFGELEDYLELFMHLFSEEEALKMISKMDYNNVKNLTSKQKINEYLINETRTCSFNRYVIFEEMTERFEKHFKNPETHRWHAARSQMGKNRLAKAEAEPAPSPAPGS
jgi:hypothetical protein